ncbi:endothelin-converting enzyme 1 isoform X1 [Hydra vulgaris]|uniref:endothelin-converting enzyme 1 isoform X1 n=2 Tax=Hydra vulgaris TaxID=6087 RepID=UPI0006413666|nr:endothelin-converting enzyme 1 isoform X1 [Hydra vulgaris]
MAKFLRCWTLVTLFIFYKFNHLDCKSINSFEKYSKVCNSKECQQVAETIKQGLNTSEEPCNDFYEFACGGWKKQHKLSHEVEINTFSILKNKIEKEIHKLLEEEPQADWNEAMVKAHSYYKSCMDTATIEMSGPKPALEFISQIGGWSLCNNKEWEQNSKQYNIYEVLSKLHRNYFPAPPFFTVEIVNDQMNLEKNQIRIDKSGLGLLRKELYFNHSEILHRYGSYMVEVAQLLGYTCNDMDPENNVTAQMLSIVEFEEKLANLSFAEDVMRVNISSLMEIIPNFDWNYHLTSIFPESFDIKKSEIILSTSPSYLFGVADLIKTTDKRVLSRYVVWQLLQDKISYLSEDFRKIDSAFKNTLGTQVNSKRWKTCTEATNTNMGLPIASMFISKYMNNSTKLKVVEIFEEIKLAFKQQIKGYKWLDEKMKKFAIEKIDGLVAKIGYPSYIVNEEELNKRFEKLDIDKTTFFVNNLNIAKWRHKQLFEKLRKPVDKEEWQIYPQDIDVMYLIFNNEIIIPAGALQSPLFHSGKVPRSINYGFFGSLVGHEITHGFDPKGQMHDKNGDYIKDGWSRKTSFEYFKKSKCFVEQYNEFKVGKQSVNGNLTLVENIADNGGCRLSLKAYENYLQNNTDTRLPTLEYTDRQLFFISFAQGYCANAKQEVVLANALMEGRAPSKFRVIGTLSNTEGFAKAFNCRKKGEENNNGIRLKMDPKKKCVMW